MAGYGGDLGAGLLSHRAPTRPRRGTAALSTILIAASLALLVLVLLGRGWVGGGAGEERVGAAIDARGLGDDDERVEAEHGVVAADDGRCSEIGAAALRAGGHAVDAAVAAALCLGVVSPRSSGIGGGGFMVVRSAASGKAEAFDSRETAPLASFQTMYDGNPASKSNGALSMGVPGELAGLHAAWSRHGRLPWKSLLQPSIALARDGFRISPSLADSIQEKEALIRADPGLRSVFVLDGQLLRAGDTARNPALAHTLAAVAADGPRTLYGGAVGEALIRDVQDAGGLLTMDDLRSYNFTVTDALTADALGYTIVGMPPPSSGTVGLSMIAKILAGYGSPESAGGALGVHRLVEALKHMFAVRMNLGDPDFVNVTAYVSEMLSSSFAEKIRRRILDDATFGPEYYLPRWSQLSDHGTSHLCVVDSERNAVSMTSTVNFPFGGGVLSPGTGIVLNNEMDDFSTPGDSDPDKLPPAPSNFIEPRKRPLSSMTPIIVLKDGQLAGIIGASGGLNIISAVTQVFLNHFVLGMEALDAVRHPRVYHKLIPNVVKYENLTTTGEQHIGLSAEARAFLAERGHVLSPVGVATVCQLVVQDLRIPVDSRKEKNRGLGEGEGSPVFHGLLTAVSDPRKGGRPAGL